MRGLLLVNIGTPDAPTTPAVRRYLREFLSDPRVIDIHPVARKALLELIILPTRPKKSAAAYQKVWTDQGSPLLVVSEQLSTLVQDQLGQDWKVGVGMRYGNPSIEQAMTEMDAAGVDSITVLPMYPQYASASTGSSLEHIYRLSGTGTVTRSLNTIPPFYDDPRYIDALLAITKPHIDELKADHVLFSMHGLPARQVKATAYTPGLCQESADCCDRIVPANRSCYRAQCMETARLLAKGLSLHENDWSVSFQSRLGRTPWIQPYTDHVIPQLAQQGVKKLAVLLPSFTTDCLETLEEMGIRGREMFIEAGGEAFGLVPCLNASPAWVEAVADMARQHSA